jgi:DNA-binding LytR/AlgR family response regulator
MLRVIIIEDEAPLAAGLAASLRKLRPDIQIVATAAGVQEAVDAIRRHPDIDLVFADICLGDGYSFDVFDEVRTDAMIVFTTAYDEYALKAFDYDCIDYLLKPIDLKDLEDALDRYEKRVPSTHVADSRRVAARLFSGEKAFRSRLKLDRVDSTVIIDTRDICYVEYDLGNVKVFCKDRMNGTTTLSLTKLAGELDPSRFIKVSRTHIVNLAEILMIKPTLRRSKTLVLKEPYGNVSITVTSEMIRELKQRMDLGKAF